MGTRTFKTLCALLSASLSLVLPAYALAFSVSGTVKTSRGTAISGVIMTLSGAKTAVVKTNFAGAYSFSGLYSGNYAVTPSKTGYNFTPSTLDVTISSADKSNQNFTGTTSGVVTSYAISGTVETSVGVAISAVTINLTGPVSGAAITSATGVYSFAGLVNGTYTVTPSKIGYTFTPQSLTVTINGASKTNQNFIGATYGTTYSVSGTVKSSVGLSIAGAAISFSVVLGTGTVPASVTTDSNGNWSQSGFQSGTTYRATPSMAGYTFSPAYINFTMARSPLIFIGTGSVPSPCDAKIPVEQWPSDQHASISYATPPYGYGSIIAWANVTIGSVGPLLGRVTVKRLDLWEEINGKTTLIASSITCPGCTNPDDQVWGFTLEKAMWRDPAAWSKSNEGTEFQINAQGYVVIPAEIHPTRVYHFWNTLWPRPAAKQGAKYYVMADALVEGNAIIQIGADYWQTTDGCPQTSKPCNVEAMNSNWYCASPDWQSVSIGK